MISVRLRSENDAPDLKQGDSLVYHFSQFPSATSSFSTSASRKLLQYAVDPRTVLPARSYLPLTLASDGNHHHLPITYNGQSLNVIVDTGSSDLMVLNSEWCAKNRDHGTCYIYNASTRDSDAPSEEFRLYLDNEFIRDLFSAKINGTLELRPSVLGTRGKDVLSQKTLAFLSSNLVFDAVRAPNKVLHAFPGADGLLGFAYSSLGDGIGAKMLRTVGDSDPVFSLDLNGEGKESKLWVGGIDEQYRDQLVWATPDSYDYHKFIIRDLTVCGVDLIDNFTDYTFHVIVDTGSSCLGLPEELFDSLTSWLPVQCYSRSFYPGSIRKDVECVLLPDTIPLLPTLSFTVASLEPGGSAKRLYLPLEDLLIDRSLCIRRSGVVADPILRPTPVVLSFGNRALRSLFTTLHMSTKQVALANKNINQKNSDVQCVPRTVCKGMQIASVAYNQCEDPDCYNYYFFKFDDVEKVCYLSSTFHIITAVLFTVFFGGEILMTEVELWLGRKIAGTFQRTAVPN